MAERSRGMGRGLAAILTTAAPVEGDDAGELRELSVGEIAPNPNQPRRAFDEQALVALSESLKVRGVLQPVLVRPVAKGYELIAGERRWRAAKLAGRETVPAVVRPHDDAASLELALIENMAREDLNPIEQARACQALVDELGLTREEIGQRVGRSRVAVSNLLRLLDLPDETVESIERGDLSEGHGRAILLAPEHEERRRIGRAALAEGWTVRRVEAEARASAGDRPAVARKPRKRRGESASADQLEAAERLSEQLTGYLGLDVRVAPKGEGFALSLAVDSWDEAVELAQRIGAGEPAD